MVSLCGCATARGFGGWLCDLLLLLLLLDSYGYSERDGSASDQVNSIARGDQRSAIIQWRVGRYCS